MHPTGDPGTGPSGTLPGTGAVADSDPAAPLVLAGRYRVLRTLGQGGMGSVYLAHDTELDRRVAVKVPHFTPGESADARERFQREARAAATLRHPNLCPVYDVGTADGSPYLTMPYIDGRTLAEDIRSGRVWPIPEVIALVRRLALALDFAHRQGVVHRDLKPGNVMLTADGEPVITDFGLARRSDAGDERLTRTGAVLGTPAYMSPEQAAGRAGEHAAAGDVYSLGVILYELLAGRLPFTGGVLELVFRIQSEEPPRPSRFRPGIPARLEEVVMTALAKKPQDRFPSMAAFAAALADAMPTDQTPLPTTLTLGPVGGPPRPPRRRWPLLAAAGGAAGMLVLLGVVVIKYRDKDGKERELPIDPAPDTPVVVQTTGNPVVVKPAAGKPEPTGKAVAAAESKAAVGEGEPSAGPIPPRVQALIDRLSHDDSDVRKTAAESLMKLGDAARPAVPALARRVTDDRICTSVVYFGSDKDAAVDALRKFAPDRVEAAIIEASKSKSVNVQRWATEALGKLDDKKK